MDDDQTTTFPSLGNLSLSDNNLADEDFANQSNILDASFEYDSQPAQAEDDTDLLPPPVPGPGPEDEYAYRGSMGAPIPPVVPVAGTSALPSREREAPPGRVAGQARATVEEDDELGEGATEEERARWDELRNERDRLRAVNRMLLQVSAGFDQVEGKMERVAGTIQTTHSLLDLYSRLSSQAEHTQQLLLDPNWEGLSKDIEVLAVQEAEEHRRQQEEADRLAREEAERERERARAAAKAEDDERRRKLADSRKPAVRGSVRGRGVASSVRGTTSTGTGTSRIPPTSGTTNASFASSSAGSGIGRGGPPLRGSGTVTGVRGVRGLRSRGIARGTSAGAGSAGPK